MRFDEHDDRDPRVREYIDFARSSDPEIADVADARRILASAVKAIQRMYHTFSGCDWCDQCGGGNIAMGEAQDEAKQAIEYIEAAGETYTLSHTCHSCWHFEATQMRDGIGWSIPVCDKCADLEDHKASRREEIEPDHGYGVWHVSDDRR